MKSLKEWANGKEYQLTQIVFLSCYFVRNLLQGLAKGGRWDLYQQIAMADRLRAGQGLFYSPELASSPYFPGVGFLSFGISLVAHPIRDYVLLFLASAIGAAFIFGMMRLAERYVKNKWVSLLAFMLFLLFSLENYQSYMNEFKPDTIILVIGMALIYLCDALETGGRPRNILNWLAVCGLTFLMGIFKQHALYLDVGLGIYFLFTKDIPLKGKAYYLSAMFAGGLLDIAAIFSIPGITVLTMQNLKDMPWYLPKEIAYQVAVFGLNNFPLCCAILAFFVLAARKKIRLDGLATKYLLMAALFAAGQILGAYKIGGNGGNTEVAVVTFLPFAAIAIDYAFSLYGTAADTLLKYASAFVCLFFALLVLARTVPFIKSYRENQRVVAYLRRFEGKTFLYNSNQYMNIYRSGVQPGMDMLTSPYHIDEYHAALETALTSKTYEYVLLESSDYLKRVENVQMKYQQRTVHLQLALDENYTEVSDADMPQSLRELVFKKKGE